MKTNILLVESLIPASCSVIVKNPSDFVGSYIGHSERNTRGILESTKGKVLVIDEVCLVQIQAPHQTLIPVGIYVVP